MDQISDLEFPTRREGDMSQYLEYLIVEFVITDICKISYVWIGRFFYDPSCFLCSISSKDTEKFGVIYSLAESCIPSGFCKFQDIGTLIEVIPREYYELTCDISL
jgi:hypothetical protein